MDGKHTRVWSQQDSSQLRQPYLRHSQDIMSQSLISNRNALNNSQGNIGHFDHSIPMTSQNMYSGSKNMLPDSQESISQSLAPRNIKVTSQDLFSQSSSSISYQHDNARQQLQQQRQQHASVDQQQQHVAVDYQQQRQLQQQQHASIEQHQQKEHASVDQQQHQQLQVALNSMQQQQQHLQHQQHNNQHRQLISYPRIIHSNFQSNMSNNDDHSMPMFAAQESTLYPGNRSAQLLIHSQNNENNNNNIGSSIPTAQQSIPLQLSSHLEQTSNLPDHSRQTLGNSSSYTTPVKIIPDVGSSTPASQLAVIPTSATNTRACNTPLGGVFPPTPIEVNYSVFYIYIVIISK